MPGRIRRTSANRYKDKENRVSSEFWASIGVGVAGLGLGWRAFESLRREIRCMSTSSVSCDPYTATVTNDLHKHATFK